MEIVLALFLGAWISLAGIFAFLWLKKEYRPYLKKDSNRGILCTVFEPMSKPATFIYKKVAVVTRLFYFTGRRRWKNRRRNTVSSSADPYSSRIFHHAKPLLRLFRRGRLPWRR